MKHTPKQLYTIVEKAIPEPGINKAAVMAMLKEANEFGEGMVMYLRQTTVQLIQELILNRHTYHTKINDFDFQKRILEAIVSKIK